MSTPLQHGPAAARPLLARAAQTAGEANGYAGAVACYEFDALCRTVLEQPQQLEEVVPEVMATVCARLEADVEAREVRTPHVYSLAYSLLDVRGIRFMGRHFPSGVRYLEPLVHTLAAVQAGPPPEIGPPPAGQPRNSFTQVDAATLPDKLAFRMQYVLLYWLSILVMSPFDVGALDTDGALSATLVQACLSYRRLSSKLTQMANEALARFLVRSDCAALRDEVVGRANDAVEAAAGQARRVSSETAAYLSCCASWCASRARPGCGCAWCGTPGACSACWRTRTASCARWWPCSARA